jgi:hypothetical protein
MQKTFDNIILASGQYDRIIDVAELTQKILKDKFGKNVELIVKSESPSAPNQFEIDRDNLTSFAIDLNKKFNQTLENEITLIISDLLQKAQ